MEGTIFQAHPEIIQIVFEVLDSPTLLNCRLVCKNWNQFLETPNFWLKKLKEIGQPEKVETKWKSLIAKSEGSEVEKSVFAKCLRMKFQDFINDQEEDEYSRNCSIQYLRCGPLYTAAKLGFVEIVKLIYQLGEDCNHKIVLNQINNYFVMPIFVAIENGHTEVAKFLLETQQEIENPSVNYWGESPILEAITSKNLDLVKFILPKISNINEQPLIHYAIEDYSILKYLLSQPGIDPNLNYGRTALQLLCDFEYTRTKYFPPGDFANMIRILAPLANKEDLYSGYGESPLHIAAKTGNVKALKTLLEFFDANEKDKFGLPLDSAIKYLKIECVQVLAPLTTDLIIDEDFCKNTKILDILQSIISERQEVSKVKMEGNSHEPAEKKSRAEE